MTEQDEKNSVKERFKKWLDNKEDKKAVKKPVPIYLIIILLFGIILMVIGTLGKEKEEEPSDEQLVQHEGLQEEAIETNSKASGNSDVSDTERAIQTRLSEMLEKISGVSEVKVMVNLQGTEEKVYEKDTTIRQQITSEEDREGGKRDLEDGTKEEQIVIVRQGEQEEPLLIHTKKPEARGVLVVAEGVEDIKVKEWVVEAVTKVMDIPPHKVSVLPRNREEGE
ncbi:stage III sporulation protein AG [Alteribacillus sp. JSM 102045]|uniref:stage III sporulation protein AG n=1 Tax=Alteribacillus sp. JSM 102045 TaxID=1562101 RepID=UPI0035BEDDCF